MSIMAQSKNQVNNFLLYFLDISKQTLKEYFYTIQFETLVTNYLSFVYAFLCPQLISLLAFGVDLCEA